MALGVVAHFFILEVLNRQLSTYSRPRAIDAKMLHITATAWCSNRNIDTSLWEDLRGSISDRRIGARSGCWHLKSWEQD